MIALNIESVSESPSKIAVRKLFIFIERLRCILTREDRSTLVYLSGLVFIVSTVELVGIAAIMPFLSVAADFSIVYESYYLNSIFQLVGSPTEFNFLLIFGIGLLFFYVFRCLLLIFNTFAIANFYHHKHRRVAADLYSRYMQMGAQDFSYQSVPNLTKNIVAETQILSSLLNSFLVVCTEFIIVLFIVSLFFYVNAKATLIGGSIIIGLGVSLTLLIRNLSRINGIKRAEFQGLFFSLIAKGLSNHKLSKFNANPKESVIEFESIGMKYSDRLVNESILNALPRSILELLSFCGIIGGVLYILMDSDGVSLGLTSIGEVGVFAVGFLRILPSLNRILAGYNSINFNGEALRLIVRDLALPIEHVGYNPIFFRERIEVRDVSFSFGNKAVFSGLRFKINKGQKIALVGSSGVGKSTLADIISGILAPNSGSIVVDGTLLTADNLGSWRALIGYIPQTVVLFDGTVLQNVALGREIDEALAIECLMKAQIWDYLLQNNGLETQVGDRGVSLSGGQIQRIGIARALYKRPQLIIFDESTSALDLSTEQEIIRSVFGQGDSYTVLAIAHRRESVKHCDRIFRLKDQRIVEVSKDDLA